MKKFAIELWDILRFAVASVLRAVGYFIGIPMRILEQIYDMLLAAGDFVDGPVPVEASETEGITDIKHV